MYEPAAKSTLRKMDPRKRLTQTLEISSGSFGHKILESYELKAWSKMEGFRLQVGMSHMPHGLLAHGRGSKRTGPLKHKAGERIPLARNSISLEPGNIKILNQDSSNFKITLTYFKITC